MFKIVGGFIFEPLRESAEFCSVSILKYKLHASATHVITAKWPRTPAQQQAGKFLSPGWRAVHSLVDDKDLKVTTDTVRKLVNVVEHSTGAALQVLRWDGDESTGKYVVRNALPGVELAKLEQAADAATVATRSL